MKSVAARALADAAGAFDRLGVRWFLFGAQAAIFYGHARSTADVDLTVELGGHSTEALVGALGAARIVPRVLFDAAFVAATRVLPLVHEPTGLGVDIVLAGPGPDESFLSRARTESFEGVVVKVVDPSDLLVMKILAARPKDIEDVRGLLRVAPKGLDLDDVRAQLRELEGLLDQSDLVAALDEAVRLAGRR